MTDILSTHPRTTPQNSPTDLHALQTNGGHDYFLDDKAELPYTLVGNLGHGQSATVEKVQDRRTGRLYARKVFRIYSSRDERKHLFENEIKIIRRLESHHHIIRVFETFVTNREVGFILGPVADRGDLAAFLHDLRERGSVPIEDRRILETSFGCLSSALSFIHEHKVRHKDIKPQNILVHQGSIIYTDFGYSLDYRMATGSTTDGRPHARSRKYCAPEVNEWEPRNSKSDVYSLGCVFLEIYATLGALSLPDSTSYYHEYLQEIQTTLLEIPEHRPDRLIADLAFRMLQLKPYDRPSAEDITRTLWLGKAYDFCSLCASTLSKGLDGCASSAFRSNNEIDSGSVTLPMPRVYGQAQSGSASPPRFLSDTGYSQNLPERLVERRDCQHSLANTDVEAARSLGNIDVNVHRTTVEMNRTDTLLYDTHTLLHVATRVMFPILLVVIFFNIPEPIFRFRRTGTTFVVSVAITSLSVEVVILAIGLIRRSTSSFRPAFENMLN